ncbi:unnamed protein product [Microthlaspi erraticum]|uniref:Uncharacterized protein n=1 Tax=Microthlaspi erraticum TaxID=1685480 RepID=A0A6D2JTI8_9BRAS|nr:unnamed protein product [Microthlaspi erraticum]
MTAWLCLLSQMASNGEPQLNDDSGSETEDDVTETSPTPPLTTKNKRQREEKETRSSKRFEPESFEPEIMVSSNGTSNLKKHNMVSCKAFSAWTTANSGKKDQTVLSSDGSDVRLCKMSEKVIREASNEMIVLASCL